MCPKEAKKQQIEGFLNIAPKCIAMNVGGGLYISPDYIDKGCLLIKSAF